MEYSFDYLANESYSLLVRLNQVKPFSMTMPMVKGASVSPRAFKEVISLLEKEKGILRKRIYKFIEKIKDQQKTGVGEKDLQTGFTILKLRFNSILDQLDIFAEVLIQRGEYETGVWLAGLDALAEDGLATIRQYAELPALMVYLVRGHGAAIRRARTRLPGGDENPVAIIQVPRERMVGSGIAASLIHEVGHQVSSLLNLVPSLTTVLAKKEAEGGNVIAWGYLKRCISEILSDLWAMGHLGVAATQGLMGVVSLPRYFQFRLDLHDPHPAPYLRVELSCALGKKMFPDAQWDRLWSMWQTFYPKDGLDKESLGIIQAVEKEIGQFADIILNHSNQEMKGKRLAELFPLQERNPANLRNLFKGWKTGSVRLYGMAPTLVFAVLGQAKAGLIMNAAEETSILTRQLRRWAFAKN